MFRFFRLAAVLIGLAGYAAHAQTSAEYADMARRAWSAFECAALASSAGLTDQQERLFRIGYEQGKVFLDATLASKVDRADISTRVPIGFTLRMQGPSADFVLGRVWEGAVENALSDVHEDDGEPVNSEIWPMRAETKFQQANCDCFEIVDKKWTRHPGNRLPRAP